METENVKISPALQEKLKSAKKVVVLTGAGVSAESGVPTFRGEGGLWRKYRPEELATPYAFQKDAKLVWEWYDWRRGLIAPLEPNPGHNSIAQMEEFYPDFALVTQNIDGLHKKAGSRSIIELHGNIWRVRCTQEGTITENKEVPLKEIPPYCQCGALLRPDVVWFGESLPPEAIEQSFELSQNCELMFVVGTSAVVQPAASLPVVAKQSGAYVVEVNMEPTPISSTVDQSFFGPAGKIMPILQKHIR
jgi:NAD-dependent deacetylase